MIFIHQTLQKPCIIDIKSLCCISTTKKNQPARIASIEIKRSSGLIPIRCTSIYDSKNSEHKISDKLAVYIVSAQEINPPTHAKTIKKPYGINQTKMLILN